MNIRKANQSHTNPARIVLLAIVLLSGSAAQAQALNPTTVSLTSNGHRVRVDGQCEDISHDFNAKDAKEFEN